LERTLLCWRELCWRGERRGEARRGTPMALSKRKKGKKIMINISAA